MAYAVNGMRRLRERPVPPMGRITFQGMDRTSQKILKKRLCLTTILRMKNPDPHGYGAKGCEPVERRGVIFIVAACIFLSGCQTVLTPLPTVENRSYASLLEWAKQNDAPGSVLIVNTPKANFAAAYGFADREGSVTMTANHSFRIASISKSFIGITAAQAAAYHEPVHDITIVYLTNTSHMKARGLGRRREEFTRLLTAALFELSLRSETESFRPVPKCGADIVSAGLGGILPPEARGEDAP